MIQTRVKGTNEPNKSPAPQTHGPGNEEPQEGQGQSAKLNGDNETGNESGEYRSLGSNPLSNGCAQTKHDAISFLVTRELPRVADC